MVEGKVINGPDLSFESPADNLRYLDTFGHGTHMAGVIAGRDTTAGPPSTWAFDGQYVGVAPSARLLSLKVADATGATDVSQVIAAIDWVVQHRFDHGMNVRVINLSFGTSGAQSPALDPLAAAVENAWRSGIVVVAAAGNRGEVNGAEGGLDNPAADPYVIAVGAEDTASTPTVLEDDSVPSWSSGGAERGPDVLAPGVSVLSLRDPGSYLDLAYPEGRVGTRFFRGSGTSLSTAVVSGAVALLLSARPNLSPDQVKALLAGTARPLTGAASSRQGAGVIDVATAVAAPVPSGSQSYGYSTAAGMLEAARGSSHVALDGVELTGESDIFGVAWDGRAWVKASRAGTSWSGGVWNGSQWTGDGWTATSWAGEAWAPAVVDGEEEDGNTWADHSWSGNSWSGNSWSGNSWSGNSWSFLPCAATADDLATDLTVLAPAAEETPEPTAPPSTAAPPRPPAAPAPGSKGGR
jgi:serine protease AprX